MTELKRQVKREFRSKWPFIIILDPDGYIRLKTKRCRRTYSISIEALFYLLARETKEKKGNR